MREKIRPDSIGAVQSKSVIFRLIKRNDKPALEGRHYPSQKIQPSEEIIFDPDSNKRRTIRYAPGEISLFKDEQPEKVVVGTIIFQNGSISVPRNNPMLLEFLEKSNYNQSNPDRLSDVKQIFAVMDEAATAKDLVEDERTQNRASNTVLNMNFADLKAYARVLGVNIKNEGDIIIHDMLQLAKADPESFMSGIDDPLVKRQQVILDAMEFKIIEVNARNISWVFGEKKSLIVPAPLGSDVVSWFAEWTLNEKDGQAVYKDIDKKVNKLSSE